MKKKVYASLWGDGCELAWVLCIDRLEASTPSSPTPELNF